jgi:hypothetical protein
MFYLKRGLALAALATLGLAQRGPDVAGRSVAQLLEVAGDRQLTLSDREQALTEVMHLSYDAAVKVAPSLLDDTEPAIRFRAAWILADDRQPGGADALRKMATDRSSGMDTLAARALGRSRDTRGHETVRSLLRSALEDPNWLSARPRADAFLSALSDYGDREDAEIMIAAVKRQLKISADWVEADDLGRTGAPEAIPLLTEIFKTSDRGWAVIAAGLGLARCGSEVGVRYVSGRLGDSTCCRAPDGTPQNGLTDDPLSSRATSFILDRLGVPLDERFVPLLLQIAKTPSYSAVAKAQAWIGLSRINSVSYRQEVLRSAWENVAMDGAARIVVLNDEEEAQAYVRRSTNTATSVSLERALATSARERRHWSESRGYAF